MLRDRIQRTLAPRAVVALSRLRLPRPWRGQARVELYFAYDDPYAAVALPGLLALTRARGLPLSLYPLLQRGIPGDPAEQQRQAYSIVDAGRLLQREGRSLSRRQPLAAADCAFLAAWTEAARGDAAMAEFAAAAVEALWLGSDGPLPREALAQLHRRILGREPAADSAPWQPALAANTRRLHRRGHWESPAAWVDGEWFFAHERLPQIAAALDRSMAPMNTPTGGPRVEYFFSFRSPYSYLSAPRVFELPARYGVELVWRGVRPMAMRGQPLPRAKQFYILRDAAREADRLGLPFGRIHDPLGEGVWRCLCIAEHALERGRLAPFVTLTARAIWAEGQEVLRDAPLRALCERAGLQWQACQKAIATPAYRERVEANTAQLAELGHWGVPTLVYDGEAYWGQDRIEDLERALRRAA